MLHGYAWFVTYPRRPEQSFVSTDQDHVALQLAQALNIKWSVKATLVGFHGATALHILTYSGDLLERIPEHLRKFFKTTKKEISTN